MKKKISTKKNKAISSHHSGEILDQALLNQTIKLLKETRKKSEGKFFTMKFSMTEHEHMIDGLTKAKRYRRLYEKHKKLEENHNLFDEVAEYYLNIIVRARKAIPEIGATLDDYKEVCQIIKAPLPRLGKRPTYSDEFNLEVLEYHENLIDNIRKKTNNKKILPQQKREAVLAVNNKYFPMSDPDSTTQFLRRIGAEKGTLPGNRAFYELTKKNDLVT